jgi:hypothetical protein
MRAATFALLLGVACGEPKPAAKAERPAEPVGQSAKFAPPEGRTLLVVGQDLASIASYTEAVWPAPGGVTGYIRFDAEPPAVPGLRSVSNDGAGDNDASQLLERYPDSVLVLGLYLVDHSGSHLEQVADGTLDPAIDELGAFIREAQRPLLLRIGYEFDGDWNHYEPEPYKAAFRHVVERLRQTETDNFASVWQSATSSLGNYKNLPIASWYPGDDVVDWAGSSYFVPSAVQHDKLLAFAREHDKPVLIAESTPQGYDLAALTFSDTGQTLLAKTPEAIWSEWYAPYFAFVHANADVIRGLAYIDCNWAAQPMWSASAGNGYWGDSRVEVQPLIRERWLVEIEQPGWQHGSPELFVELALR